MRIDRAWRTTLRILKPLPGLKGAFGIGLSIAGVFGLPAAFGFAVANVYQQSTGVGVGALALPVVFAFLAFIAVYRVENLDAPLAIDSDKDRYARRLTIENRNAFTIHNCYVALKDARVLKPRSAATNALPPGLGFRFAWSSWQVQGSGPLADIPRNSRRSIDIVGLSEQDRGDEHLYHASWSGNQTLPIRQTFPLPPGEYVYKLEIGSDDTPASEATVRITLEKGRLLHMHLDNSFGWD